jgi:hypothetical protein
MTLLAAALSSGCTSTATSDAAYVPSYYYATVGSDPLGSAVDPFYYADPTWTSRGGNPGDSTVPPTPFDDLTSISNTIVGVQKALAPVFSALRQLASGSESSAGGLVHAFPPLDLPAGAPLVTARLKVVAVAGSDRAWLLEVKPLGSADSAYVGVAAGTMGNLMADHQGSGVMVVGFTELHGVNSSAFPATGRAIIAANAGQNQTKAVLIRLKDFSSDGTAAPISTVLAGDRTSDGITHVRVATQANVVTGSATEKIVDRISWQPNKGGGGYAIITGGDVDTDKYLLGRSCWADKTHLLFRDWRACALTRTPADCLADQSAVVRVDMGTSPSDCTGSFPPLPATALTADDTPTETAPVQPPALPQDMNISLP